MNYVIYFSDAGAPATGLTPSIITYKKVADGSDVASPPAVSAIGGGGYKFTATPAEALFVVVDGGASLADADRYKVMQITPNDADLDAPVSAVDTVVDAIKAKTDNLPADPANESNVQGHVADALAAYDPPTKAELDAAVSPLALEATLTAIKGSGWSTETLKAIKEYVDDLEGRLTAARAGYLDELAAANIPADIDNLLARLTALRAGYLDNLSGGAVALEANVQGQVADALAAYDPPTKAEMDAALAALNDLSVGDLLAGDLSDSLSFPANSLADRLRKLFWILCNRMIITDASGAFTAYKGDGVTPGATGTIVDNGTNTVRSAPTWP
jgi:hypothetical protein